MNKKLLKIFGIILGAVTILLAILVFTHDVGYYESNLSYGGDAYTGIQNAAAQTSNNVKYVGEMLRFALGSQMLVAGLAMVLGSLCIRVKEKKEIPAPAPVQTAAEPWPFAPAGTGSYKPPVTAEAEEWRCTRCKTLNEGVGIYCHVCGKAKEI